MRKLFTLLLIIAATTTWGQVGWVRSISKDGKATHKECKSLSVEATKVLFIVNGTTYQLFYLAGTDPDGKPIWADAANDKLVARVVQADGTIVFHKTEKKAFYYKP
jgi:hypothetical protein